jgi:hypothetical protein
LDLGEDLISCLCLGVKSRALVLNATKIGCLEWWWLGVFIAPTTKTTVGVGLLSMGAPDSPVRQPRHPTVRVLTISTVGALTSWGTGQSGAAPDRYCSLSGAPSSACSDSTRTVCALCSCQSTVVLVSRCSAGTPDSPVTHRTVR